METELDLTLELEMLLKHENEYFRRDIFTLPYSNYIKPEHLIYLSNDTNIHVRSLVAGHSKTPIDILYKLSEDPSISVRTSVAINKNTPNKVLEKLIQDRNEAVRYHASTSNNNIRYLDWSKMSSYNIKYEDDIRTQAKLKYIKTCRKGGALGNYYRLYVYRVKTELELDFLKNWEQSYYDFIAKN